MISFKENQKIAKAVSVALLFLSSFLVIGVLLFAIRISSNNIFLASLAANQISDSEINLNQNDIVLAAELLSPSPTPTPEATPKPTVPVFAPQAAISIAINNNTGQDTILFSRSEDKILPIASLTKIMTALIVLERYDLDKQVVISEAAMSQEGEQGNLKLGEVLSVRDLLYITLMESSNRAAKALSEVVGTDRFIILMNEEASKLGLTNTRFVDSSGLDQGSYSSARDVARLSEYVFLNYPLFSHIIGLKSFDLYVDGKLHHKILTTNEVLGERGVIGGKTGYTNEARGCFMAIQKVDNQYYIHVVLGSENRFGEMEQILR